MAAAIGAGCRSTRRRRAWSSTSAVARPTSPSSAWAASSRHPPCASPATRWTMPSSAMSSRSTRSCSASAAPRTSRSRSARSSRCGRSSRTRVRGRDLVTGLPKTVELGSAEVRRAPSRDRSCRSWSGPGHAGRLPARARRRRPRPRYHPHRGRRSAARARRADAARARGPGPGRRRPVASLGPRGRPVRRRVLCARAGPRRGPTALSDVRPPQAAGARDPARHHRCAAPRRSGRPPGHRQRCARPRVRRSVPSSVSCPAPVLTRWRGSARRTPGSGLAASTRGHGELREQMQTRRPAELRGGADHTVVLAGCGLHGGRAPRWTVRDRSTSARGTVSTIDATVVASMVWSAGSWPSPRGPATCRCSVPRSPSWRSA